MTSKHHSSTRYDDELEDIRSRVLQMGGLVEQQIGDAVKGLVEGDLQQMERVDVGDRAVNAFEVAIDGTCALIIARRQPTAVDLRMLMGISKIVTDLERCGDKAALIARKSKARERIGDHAKNIAEQIIYIARGKDVRHIAFERLEEEANGTSGDG